MRIPTRTVKQEYQENARALHEAIWAAHEAGVAHVLPGEPEEPKSRHAAQVQGNLHSFWAARGFRLHVLLTASRQIAITIEPAPAKPRRRPVADPVDAAWSQPERRRA